MINFSTLKGLTIPEGNVTQIMDAARNVLWELDDGMAKITITGDGRVPTAQSMAAWVHNIPGETFSVTSAAEFTVPVGTTITLGVSGSSQYGYLGTVYLNGELWKTSSITGSGGFDYTVQGDVTINLEAFEMEGLTVAYRYYGKISVTEE